jgi:hypothetical protein
MAALALAIVAAALISHAALAASKKFTVPGTAMPWISNANLNPKYHYGSNDGSAPVAVPLAKLHARAGATITVSYVSGTISAGAAFPQTDANGDTAAPCNNSNGGQYGPCPSFYMQPYPIYVAELVGTFASKEGKIVGTPFALGDGPTQLTVPKGAKLLQLGVNDDLFGDNTGSWTIAVANP